jgi:tRNA(fMet)-specific endonuclease VapC
MTIADTDVLIDFLTGHVPGASLVAAALEQGILQTTVVTQFELLAGARTARQEKALRQLLESVPALPLDSPAAERAAQVRRALETRGESIGMGDSLIAGIVLQNRGTLMTRNRRHFERVDGLQITYP